MGVGVIILLGALWASILLPGVLRARRDASPIDSVDEFERSMGMLAPNRPPLSSRPSPGRHVMVLEHPARITGEGGRSRTLARRRLLLVRLAGAFLSSILLAAVFGGGVWLLAPAVLGALLAVYVAALVQLRVREEEVRRKVRRLPVAPRPRTATLEEAAEPETAMGTVRVRRWAN